LATDKLKRLDFTFIPRSAPKSGPSSSDTWNSSINELSKDFALLGKEWNSKLLLLIDALPDGTIDTSVNAFKYGLDGKHLYINHDVESTDTDLTYYNTTKDRPSTLYEALNTIYQYIATQISTVQDEINDQSAALTTTQKDRIGINIFDSTQVSTATSLDGKSENSRLNIIQLAEDLYGPVYTLGNDGNQYLTYTLQQMVNALLAIHNGTWNSDITLSHAGVVVGLQTDINSSAPGDDTYVGVPGTLEDDLNQIRNKIKVLKGTVAWTSSHTPLYVAGADSLEDLLTTTKGTGTKTATNPWGYQYDDIEGLTAVLDALLTFVGQTTHIDSTPGYSSTQFIANGSSLETAIGALDAAVAIQSGLSSSAFLRRDGTLAMQGDLNHGGYDARYIQQLEVIDTATISGNLSTSGTCRVETTLQVGQDIEITSSGYGYIMSSASGTKWRLQIDDSGNLFTTSL
jgi:hypothetical protein